MSCWAMRWALRATGLSASSLAWAGQQRGLGQLLHDVGEVVAVQAGGRQHHVHARAAQLFARRHQCTPVTRPPASHTGSTPSGDSACASSRPKWRMVSTDHRLKVSFSGALPCSWMCSAIRFSAACLPASHACWVGTREGSKP